MRNVQIAVSVTQPQATASAGRILTLLMGTILLAREGTVGMCCLRFKAAWVVCRARRMVLARVFPRLHAIVMKDGPARTAH